MSRWVRVVFVALWWDGSGSKSVVNVPCGILQFLGRLLESLLNADGVQGVLVVAGNGSVGGEDPVLPVAGRSRWDEVGEARRFAVLVVEGPWLIVDLLLHCGRDPPQQSECVMECAGSSRPLGHLVVGEVSLVPFAHSHSAL